MTNFELPTEETFSFKDAVAGRTYATESVDIYLDEDAAKQLSELGEYLQGTALTEEQRAEGAEHGKELLARLLNTKYTWELQGIDPKLRDEILNTFKNDDTLTKDEKSVKQMHALVREMLLGILDKDKRADRSEKTVEEVEDLLSILPESERAKVFEAVNKLVLTASFFAQATDAGFLQKP